MKISKDGQDITLRFFEAIDMLIAQGKIRGLQTFTRAYGLNYWNVCTIKGDPSTHILKNECLYYLVRDFDVSAEWLLTGIGNMFGNKLKRI